MPRHSRLRILQEILLVSGFALLILILLLAMPSRMLVPLGQAAAIAGAVVGLATFAKAIEEYAKQGDQKRAEKFVEIQRALDDERFSRYWDWLVTDNAQLAKRSRAEKYFLIGLFEQVALLVNSGLMRREVAHYMFGYRAIRCWNSTQFWANLDDKDSDMYVSLFKDFVRQMQEVEASFKFDSGRFRF